MVTGREVADILCAVPPRPDVRGPAKRRRLSLSCWRLAGKSKFSADETALAVRRTGSQPIIKTLSASRLIGVRRSALHELRRKRIRSTKVADRIKKIPLREQYGA